MNAISIDIYCLPDYFFLFLLVIIVSVPDVSTPVTPFVLVTFLPWIGWYRFKKQTKKILWSPLKEKNVRLIVALQKVPNTFCHVLSLSIQFFIFLFSWSSESFTRAWKGLLFFTRQLLYLSCYLYFSLYFHQLRYLHLYLSMLIPWIPFTHIFLRLPFMSGSLTLLVSTPRNKFHSRCFDERCNLNLFMSSVKRLLLSFSS